MEGQTKSTSLSNQGFQEVKSSSLYSYFIFYSLTWSNGVIPPKNKFPTTAKPFSFYPASPIFYQFGDSVLEIRHLSKLFQLFSAKEQQLLLTEADVRLIDVTIVYS